MHLGTKFAISEKFEWQDHFVMISMASEARSDGILKRSDS